MTATPDNHLRLRVGTIALVSPISDILLASLKALAEAGQTDTACRLAGRACVLLQRSHPDVARRFDVLLHRLTPKLSWSEPPRLAETSILLPKAAKTGRDEQ